MGAVFFNYIGMEAYMTPEYYKAVFNTPPEYNSIMVKFNSSDSDVLLKDLECVEGYGGYTTRSFTSLR